MNKQMCSVCQNQFNIVETHLNGSDLVTICSNCGAENTPEAEVELNHEQLARVDEIYHAIYEMCKIITENRDLEYNMSYLGPIAENVTNILLADNVLNIDKIYFPGVVTGDYDSQKIEPYYYKKNN